MAEEGGATPTYVASPVEPVATPVPPVLSPQNHTHIISIGVDDTGPPLPIVTDRAIWLPTWPESHVDVKLSGTCEIDIPDILPEFRRFAGGVIKMNPSHQTTHDKVHAGPHAGRSQPGKALIDTGSPPSFYRVHY